MSGGSYDYVSARFEDFARAMKSRLAHAEADQVSARRAFIALVEKVGRAAHELEWIDSGDSGWPDCPTLLALIGPMRLQASVDHAREAMDALRAEIERAEQVKQERT